MSESKSRTRPAGGRTGDGEVETTGVEKVLAVVLGIFIAIGVIWGYYKLDEVAKPDSTYSYVSDQQLLGADEFSTIEKHRQASRAVQDARQEQRAARRGMVLRRENYRTALDADEPAAELQAEYVAAQARFAAASRDLAAAVAVEEKVRSEAKEAREQLDEQRQDAAAKADDERVKHDRIVFLLRLGLLVLMLAGSYRLLLRLRSQNPRYVPAALAWIGATALLAIVMATDYTESYIEFEEIGPLAISVAGVALTFAAFVALQRFLAKRLPVRRVRRGECPFCGFPVRGKPHCEGCGRAVIADCSSCQQDRRVGTARCGYCGNA